MMSSFPAGTRLARLSSADICLCPDVRAALGAGIAVEVAARKGKEELLPRRHRVPARGAIQVGRGQLLEPSRLAVGLFARYRLGVSDAGSPQGFLPASLRADRRIGMALKWIEAPLANGAADHAESRTLFGKFITHQTRCGGGGEWRLRATSLAAGALLRRSLRHASSVIRNVSSKCFASGLGHLRRRLTR